MDLDETHPYLAVDQEAFARRRLQGLARATVEIAREPTLEAVLSSATDWARRLIGAHHALTSLTEGGSWVGATHALALSGTYRAWCDEGARPDGTGLAALVCASNRPARLSEEELAARPSRTGRDARSGPLPPLRGWLAAPLIDRQGANMGLIQLSDKEQGEFTCDDEAILVQLAQFASVAVASARLFELARAKREEALHANRAKDRFLAAVSHELRTPLNAILGWALLLRQSTLSPEKRSAGLDVIERAARAQAQLVEDLLDVSRIISGKLRMERRSLDLVELVVQVATTVRPSAEAKGVELSLELDAGAGCVAGDPDRLRQLVLNLLANAIKFAGAGGHVRLELRRSVAEGGVELRITDDGAGIAPEALPHVFEPFRQEDAGLARQHGGLGLGLSIARHIAELHGGSIRAASPGKGAGATFTVSLPAGAREAELVQPLAGPPLGQPASGELAGVRVLLVEDDVDARDLFVTLFGTQGVVTRAVGSAEEALDALEEAKFDVLVSDLGMPTLDGYELIRRVRALPGGERARLPAVAVTAHARSEDRARAMLEGFDVHLAKPVDPDVLLAAIAALARRRRTVWRG